MSSVLLAPSRVMLTLTRGFQLVTRRVAQLHFFVLRFHSNRSSIHLTSSSLFAHRAVSRASVNFGIQINAHPISISHEPMTSKHLENRILRYLRAPQSPRNTQLQVVHQFLLTTIHAARSSPASFLSVKSPPEILPTWFYPSPTSLIPSPSSLPSCYYRGFPRDIRRLSRQSPNFFFHAFSIFFFFHSIPSLPPSLDHLRVVVLFVLFLQI